MAKESTHELLLREALAVSDERIPAKYRAILLQFVDCYRRALGPLFDDAIPHLLLFFQLVEPQFHAPFAFEPYHQKIRHPIDYYQFGLDFIRPLIDGTSSRIFGEPHLDAIQKKLRQGENAILLANHQTETDPQAIAILLSKRYPEIAEKIIYVAGERVLSDPLAIPFSMGCDLLCIYSKRYIDHPPELKAQKQLHNKNTMERMRRLLEEGGRIIYVAPSGGRDRRNSAGHIEVARFDPPSIELFYLMAKKARTPTHFIPFALATYDLLPPPETIQKELGEVRTAKRTPVFLSFAPPFDMEGGAGGRAGRSPPNEDSTGRSSSQAQPIFKTPPKEDDKIQRREKRAERIWTIVNDMYKNLSKEL